MGHLGGCGVAKLPRCAAAGQARREEWKAKLWQQPQQNWMVRQAASFEKCVGAAERRESDKEGRKEKKGETEGGMEKGRKEGIEVRREEGRKEKFLGRQAIGSVYVNKAHYLKNGRKKQNYNETRTETINRNT